MEYKWTAKEYLKTKDRKNFLKARHVRATKLKY